MQEKDAENNFVLLSQSRNMIGRFMKLSHVCNKEFCHMFFLFVL